MDRQSSIISIWLQMELCAMAVLLTKGTGFGLLAGHVCEVLQKQDEQCSAAAKHDRT